MKKRNKKAFTIIELIVVIAILGILVLLGMSNFTGQVKEANHAKRMVATKTIEDASSMYHMDNEDWPRLTDEPYTAEQLKVFADGYYDSTGKEIVLDPKGNYYDIDYDKLNQYAKAPENKKQYILQNPVGKIFYMENIQPAGENRVDYIAKKKVNSSIPSAPITSDITENSVVVTGEVGTEVKLDDGEWFNSPHTFTGLDVNTEYTVYVRFKETTVYNPSAISQGLKFSTVNSELYNFTAHTFTNAGQTGRTGPSQAQLDSAYNGSEVKTYVTSTNGIQIWAVPKDGIYRIEAYGAQGGLANNLIGGSGAIIKGDISLKKGELIKVLVGQAGSHTNYSGSGGGGTFVTKNDNGPLIVAGGGGGAGGRAGNNALVSNNGGSYSGSSLASGESGGAGINGGGGGGGSGYGSAGGGGLVGDGGSSAYLTYKTLGGNGGAGKLGQNAIGGTSDNTSGGRSFINGGNGGYGKCYQSKNLSVGGFGGAGAGGSGNLLGGAGGGYSGAGGVGYHSGAGYSSTGHIGGYGGGSFNSGANQVNSVGNTGHGKVVITYIGK